MTVVHWTRYFGRCLAVGLHRMASYSVRRPIEVIVCCTVLVSCIFYTLWHHVPTPIQLNRDRSLVTSRWKLDPEHGQFVPWVEHSDPTTSTAGSARAQVRRIRLHQLIVFSQARRSRRPETVEQQTYNVEVMRDAVHELDSLLFQPAVNGAVSTGSTNSIPSTESAHGHSASTNIDRTLRDLCVQPVSTKPDDTQAQRPARSACLSLPSYRVSGKGAARTAAKLGDRFWDHLLRQLESPELSEDEDSRDLSPSSNVRLPEAVVLSYALDVDRTQASAQKRTLENWASAVTRLSMETAVHRRTDEAGKNQSSSRIVQTLDGAFEIGMHIVDGLRTASILELVVVCTGYLLLHVTVGLLFYKMRRIGSRWTLGITAIASSFSAFCIALCVLGFLGYSIDLLFFSEAVPFLVATVGFEKPYALAKAVMSSATSSADSVPVDRVVEHQMYAGLKKALSRLLRDYLFEIPVLCFGIFSGVPGFSVFCLLSALTLIFDAILQFTLFTAVLTLKCELMLVRNQLHQAHSTNAHQAVSINSSDEPTDSGSSSTLVAVAASARRRLTRHKRTVSIDSTRHLDSLRPFLSERDSDEDDRNAETRPSSGIHLDTNRRVSVARLKLFMMIGFLGMHIFNICSAFHSHLPRYSTNTGVSSALQSLSSAPRLEDPVTRGPLFIIAAEHKRGGDPRPLVVELTTPIVFQTQRMDEEVSTLEMLVSSLFETIGKPLHAHARNATYEQLLTAGLFISLMANWYLYSGERARQSRTLPDGQRASDSGMKQTSTVLAAKHATSPAIRNGTLLSKTATVHPTTAPRPDVTCLELLSATPAQLSDEEVISLVQSGKLPGYALEKRLDDYMRAVKIRRAVVSRATASHTLENSQLPVEHYDYSRVLGQCCENVIGYTPIPVGVAGPILIDGEAYYIPMATTEGCLVASASRGCKAISAGGGATTVVVSDGMTRGPALEFSGIREAAECKAWLDEGAGFGVLEAAFNSTSRFARLQSLKVMMAGNLVFVRFKATTGDAMGMNMISKGVEKALEVLGSRYSGMKVVSISGNTCCDKKPAAVNWIDGRGKSTIAECVVPGSVVRSVLKTTAADLVRLNTTKNLIGSAVAGSIGGFNAHAANILTAIYLATGQDPAQNVESSQCMTLMQTVNDGEDLHLTCTMPCIEVGTIGGGTQLPAQAACLDMLGVRGANTITPGENARRLARIICASVMAGELSLCAALAAGHLVKSHMAHNRAKPAASPTTPCTAPASPIPGSCLKS